MSYALELKNREQRVSLSLAQRAARESARLAREESTSLKAIAIWRRARPAMQHPYLERKDVFSHGLKIDSQGNLLVPMQDHTGKVWNLQTITPDGQKLFMKGGRKAGTFVPLGDIGKAGPIIVAEGYATAATMKEASGLPTIAAFDSGNLKSVVQGLKEQNPVRLIVMAADNDHHLPRRLENPLPNVGLVKATEAANAVAGVILAPDFLPTDKGTDWNDFAAKGGKEAIRQKVAAALVPLGERLGEQITKRPVTAPVSQTQRDAARKRGNAQSHERSIERATNRPTARPTARPNQARPKAPKA